MSAIRWLATGRLSDEFPPPADALDDPNGLLAVGGDLTSERLLFAYRAGIFPWYEAGQPILWWSPNPRAVMLPENLHVSRTLAKTLDKETFKITADTAFERVMQGCAAPRSYTDSTWITDDMMAAYTRLHHLGWAHSVEVWQNETLVGGLYGISIGRVFFGESMFSRVTDASKVAFVHAVRYLQTLSCELIDCQVGSSHLTSLGAGEMPRDEFLARLETLCEPAIRQGSWSGDFVPA